MKQSNKKDGGKNTKERERYSFIYMFRQVDNGNKHAIFGLLF